MKLSLTLHNGMEVIRKCGVADKEKPLYKIDYDGFYHPRFNYRIEGDVVIIYEGGNIAGAISCESPMRSGTLTSIT